jgi:hypothetical protein
VTVHFKSGIASIPATAASPSGPCESIWLLDPFDSSGLAVGGPAIDFTSDVTQIQLAPGHVELIRRVLVESGMDTPDLGQLIAFQIDRRTTVSMRCCCLRTLAR